MESRNTFETSLKDLVEIAIETDNSIRDEIAFLNLLKKDATYCITKEKLQNGNSFIYASIMTALVIAAPYLYEAYKKNDPNYTAAVPSLFSLTFGLTGIPVFLIILIAYSIVEPLLTPDKPISHFMPDIKDRLPQFSNEAIDIKVDENTPTQQFLERIESEIKKLQVEQNDYRQIKGEANNKIRLFDRYRIFTQPQEPQANVRSPLLNRSLG